MNEQAFILSLQNGDPQAFRQLVETCQDMVFNAILSIVQNISEAEDLSQEVFIQLHRSISTFRGDAKLSTWLYRIAVTKAIDAERKKKARRKIERIKTWAGWGSSPEPVAFNHPGIQLENKEKAAVLFQAMRKLPINQRIAFTLLKAEGLSYEQVSRVMNITVKAVEALMHRAKENLRKYLEDYYHNLK